MIYCDRTFGDSKLKRKYSIGKTVLAEVHSARLKTQSCLDATTGIVYVPLTRP